MTNDPDDDQLDRRLARLADATKDLTPPAALIESIVSKANTEAQMTRQFSRGGRGAMLAFAFAAAASIAIAHFTTQNLTDHSVSNLGSIDVLE